MLNYKLYRDNPFDNEKYNQRIKYNKYYTNPRLKRLNDSWIKESVKSALERIEQIRREKGEIKKAKIFVNPLRQIEFRLKEYHRIQDLHRIRNRVEERLRIKTIQMYIHRDTYWDIEWTRKEIRGIFVFDWTDENGKVITLKKKQFSELVDIIKEELTEEKCIYVLEEYKKLEKSANEYYEKFLSKCTEIFHLIEPMIEIEDGMANIMIQERDGYVLSWEYYGEPTNTPIEYIIEEYKRERQPLSEEKLRLISI